MLNGKKILIAGAGGLLGKGLVKSVLGHGASVVAVDHSIKKLKDKLDHLTKDYDADRISLAELDVTNEEQVLRFFEKISTIDGAVNCTYPRNETYGAKFYDVTLGSFNENVSMHLGSAYLFLQQCAKLFERDNENPLSVVNIASVYGCVAPKFSIYDDTSMTMPVEYAAIKAAIIHLNKYVAAYIKNSKFRINSVSPGGIFDSQPEEFLNKYKEQALGKGMLEVDDVVGTIIFLLSEKSSYINGQNIVVDDGFSL